MDPEPLFTAREIRMAVMGPFWRKLSRWNVLQLGRLRQYAPRPLRLERFPESHEPVPEWPVIAMVVPSYQQGHFIERTLTSILSQNYPALICTVQDGGSRDDTTAILNQYADRLAHCVSAPDKGQADAIVKGFARTEGDIMAWLNADDMLMPGTLHHVARYFASHPEVDVVYGHRVMIDADDREIGRWVMPEHEPHTIRWIDYIPQETLFWRRSIWEKVGGVNPSFHFALDWDLLLRFQNAGATIRRLPYYLGCFRVHAEQKTQAELPTGKREVGLLHLREHGRLPTSDEIAYWTRRTQVRGAWCSWLLRLGIRR